MLSFHLKKFIALYKIWAHKLKWPPNLSALENISVNSVTSN